MLKDNAIALFLIYRGFQHQDLNSSGERALKIFPLLPP